MARPKPWDVDDELWVAIKPLLPKVERRARHSGRKRHPDRLVFQGIVYGAFSPVPMAPSLHTVGGLSLRRG
ncbi:hypothetical protein AB0D04_13395 [Streptomyces sp. NPDC048483]|uniref:hypothetical protein n=1 Tax=Streptomyces sp. NPDC048483 TaxID=3154927 RepID=UPI00344A1F23